ncbi:hypothetical protein L0Y65_05135 [Candidatus Micrarchaeota archaeon]|nr:hypothetical protein [Candidatus Micrarchaeota archaeon]
MRGMLVLLLAAGLLVLGCAGQPGAGNQTVPNMTNQSNNTPPVQACNGPVCGADGITYATDCEAELAGVSIEYQGECAKPPEPNCSDSDGGLDIATAGTVSKGNESRQDYCLDATQLVEYTCLDNAMQMASVSCGENRTCEAGRCVPRPPENTTPPAPSGCTGPAENDVYARETTTYNGMEYTDSCVDYRTIKLYYCKDNALESINNQCPSGYGCTDGQCNWLQMTCTDTDAGNDTTKRGTVTVLKGYLTVGEHTDECIDDGMVTEWVCQENGTATVSEEACPSGTWCYNDHCIKGDCSETDGGDNIYRHGITTDESGDYEDDCLSDYQIREYFCYGNEATYDDIDCGDDYICNSASGRCVEGSIS